MHRPPVFVLHLTDSVLFVDEGDAAARTVSVRCDDDRRDPYPPAGPEHRAEGSLQRDPDTVALVRRQRVASAAKELFAPLQLELSPASLRHLATLGQAHLAESAGRRNTPNRSLFSLGEPQPSVRPGRDISRVYVPRQLELRQLPGGVDPAYRAGGPARRTTRCRARQRRCSKAWILQVVGTR
jgi:hypothetical protein